MKMNFTKLSLIASLIFATLFLTSCDKEGKSGLEITSETTIEATIDGGKYEVKFTAGENWTATLGDNITWIEAEPLSGGSGEHTITLNVLRNPGYKRFTELEIKTSTVKAVARLNQAGIPIVAVTTFDEDFSEITEHEVSYENPLWSITSDDPTVAWITGIFNADKYIQVKGYNTTNEKVITSAKMPPLNIKEATTKLLLFELAVFSRDVDDTKLEVVASTDYDETNPEAATWEVVKDVTIPVEPMNAWTEREVDFATVSGGKYANNENLNVAIRYTGKAITYRLDNITFGIAKEVAPDPVAKSIAEFRKLEQGKELKENFSITGIVISNNAGEGSLHGQTVIIQESKAINSGIAIRLPVVHDFKFGEKITVTSFNGTLSEYRGTLQLALKSNDQVTSNAAADPAAAEVLIQTITVTQLETNNYQSMYVAIADAQIKSSFFGKAFNSGQSSEDSNANDGNVVASASGKDFTINTYYKASWAGDNVPEGKGSLKGIASYYDDPAAFQILLQRPSDFVGLVKP